MPGATHLAENASHGLLKSKATCYPAPKFIEMLGDKMDNEKNVVVDGKWSNFVRMISGETTDLKYFADNVVTSVGPGTALEFGLKLVSLLCGTAKGKEIAEGMK